MRSPIVDGSSSAAIPALRGRLAILSIAVFITIITLFIHLVQLFIHAEIVVTYKNNFFSSFAQTSIGRSAPHFPFAGKRGNDATHISCLVSVYSAVAVMLSVAFAVMFLRFFLKTLVSSGTKREMGDGTR